MSDLLVIVPSRGRPQNIAQFAVAWRATGTQAGLLCGFDIDDPTYSESIAALPAGVLLDVRERTNMCGTLNALAVRHAPDYFAIGFAGDDHRVRSSGWDKTVLAALREMGTGICYGNDLVHGEGLPTAVFMTADIIQALGYMAPPRQHHLFLDNAWLELGRALDAIRYLPDVIIEHMHPIVGKAPDDDGYQRVNDPAIFEHDRIEYERWEREELPAAVEKISAGTPVR